MLDRYLTKRPGSTYWQLRVPVPKDVQAQFGRREVTRSLLERDHSKAALAALPIIADLNNQWAALRQGQATGALNAAGPRSLTLDDIPPIALASFHHARAASNSNRAGFADRDEAEASRMLADSEKERVKLINQAHDGTLERFDAPAQRMLSNRDLTADPLDPLFVNLKRSMAIAVGDGIGISNDMRRGNLGAAPQSDVVLQAQAHAEAISGQSEQQRSSVATVVNAYLKQWRADTSHRPGANTEQQMQSTFRLFAEFVNGEPFAKCDQRMASEFHDKLRGFNPVWARSPTTRRLSWTKLVTLFASGNFSLADGTMNRHMGCLTALWDWARPRGYCSGENPFLGFHKKLRPGVNVDQYLAWEIDELNHLLSPPPKRRELLEVVLVGLFTGMRLDEIASLTWNRLKPAIDDQPSYFVIEDAKTTAGNRVVPVHSTLYWLAKRARGAPEQRIWSTFNLEGKGKKAGADAGRMFSDFKAKKGFTKRSKSFHSFRKNVTRIMEQNGVPENDWAQIFGHERGFTYSRYNPDGIQLSRKKAIIELIAYPTVALPDLGSSS